MKNDIRDSGIGIVGNVPSGTHFCQLHQTKEDLIEILIPFLRAGLENNELCIWITSQLFEVENAKKLLRKNISNFDDYLNRGQIEIIPSNLYTTEGIFDSKRAINDLINKINHSLTSDYDGLRLIENVCWIENEGYNHSIDYEKSFDSIMRKYPVVTLCTYSLDECNAADIIEIAANHQFTLVKRKGKWERIEGSERKNTREIKHAEELEKLLQESQVTKSRLEAILEYLPAGAIIAKAPSGKMIIGNEQVRKIFHGNLPLSVNVEDYGKYIGFHPDGRRYTEEEWPMSRAVQKGEEVIGEEIEFQLADGTRRIMSVSAAPIRDEEGRIISGFVVDEDITECKQAEKTSQFHRQLLDTVIQNIPVAINLMNGNDLRIEIVNPAYQTIAPGKEMVGKTLNELWPDLCRQVLATGEPYHEIDELYLISRFPGAPVEPAYFTWSLFRVDLPEGKGKGILDISWETTERKKMESRLKRNEERLNSLVNSIKDGFLELDREWRFTYINKRAANNGNFEPEDLVGEKIWEKFPYMVKSKFEEVYRKVMDTRMPAHFEVKGLIRDQWYEVSVYPSTAGISVFWRDITERKQVEDALREAYEEIQAQSEELQASNEELQVQAEELQVQTEELQEAYEALSESEERFRMLFTNMTEGFLLAEIICDKDGKPYDYRFLEVNPAYELNTGIKREKVLGQSILEVLPKASRTAIEKFGEVALSGKSTHFEVFSQAADKYFEVYAFSPEKGKFAVIFRDITERNKAEEALRESRTKLEAAFASMTDAIFISDAQGRFIDFNDSFATFHRFKNREECSRTFAEYPDILDVFMADGTPAPLDMWAVPRALRGETVTDAEYILQRKDTGETWVGSYSFAPIRDRDGVIVGSVVIGRDITSRKAVETELSHQREMLQQIFDNIPVLLVTWDPHLKQFTLNSYAEQVLGWTTADANNGDFMANVYPDPAYRAEVSSYMLSLKTGWREWIGTTKDGQHLPVEWANIFLTDNTMIGIGVDLRERKKSEAKLKETLDNLENLVKERTAELEQAYNSLKESEKGLAEAQRMAHIGNWEWDIVTDRVYLSDEIYRILGFEPQEFEATFKTLLSFVHPDDREYVSNAVKGTLIGSPYNIDLRVISADREERIVHSQGEIILDEENNPVRMRGIVQDITERRRTEEALAKIEEARIKEIHHRIKNNLQVISSLLDLQAETFSHLEICKVPEVIKAFKESQSRVASMALIHEELYKGKGLDSLDFAAYLRKLTADIFNSYNLGGKDINLKLNLEQVDLGIDTAIPLGIIVNELVSNSFKHAFPAGRKGEIQLNLCRIETSATKTEIFSSDKDCNGKNEFRYMLKVTDNGKGIPQEMNLENMDSLGLQLVNILVEQIDGSIGLKRDRGTEFTIWFNNIKI
jgi:PAS domain S-box-containing protein